MKERVTTNSNRIARHLMIGIMVVSILFTVNKTLATEETVYVNGNRIVRKAELPVMGDGISLCTLSGTNLDYGTRCEWKDFFIYEW